MIIKHKRTILIIVVLFLLLLFFLSSSGNTYGIFRDTLNTKVYLTVLDTSSSHTITFNTHGGTPVPEQQTRGANEPAGTLPSNVTLAGYNFIGWFDNYPNGNLITSDTPVIADVTYHAHWLKSIALASV